MAIDPATLKAVAKIATTVLSDEKGRRALLIACLIPFIILLLVLSSPFAIFFALIEGQEESVSVISILNELKQEFAYIIQLEQEDPTASETHMIVMGSEDGAMIDNTEDVLIAYAVMYNVTKENPEQMAVLSEAQVANLKDIYRAMNIITISVETVSETIEVITTDANGNQTIENQIVNKNIKTIQVDCLTAEEIGIMYGFDETQMFLISEMRKSGYGGWLATYNVRTILTNDQIEEIRSYMPEGLIIERSEVEETALSIVGQVPYFWGGKSVAIGWDSQWGTMMEVTALGSPSTGTMEPFGLDCSGYVTWVFANMGLPAETIDKTIGHGTGAQWSLSSAIPESISEPGDLAFLAIPGTRKVNHVGIVVGKDENGAVIVAHCTSGADNVVVTTAESAGFMHYRRPAVLIK